jgi:hypothetical protein
MTEAVIWPPLDRSGPDCAIEHAAEISDGSRSEPALLPSAGQGALKHVW